MPLFRVTFSQVLQYSNAQGREFLYDEIIEANNAAEACHRWREFAVIGSRLEAVVPLDEEEARKAFVVDPPLCKECANFFIPYGYRNFPMSPRCLKGKRDPVWGFIKDECESMRYENGACGPQGKLFERKPAEAPSFFRRLFWFR